MIDKKDFKLLCGNSLDVLKTLEDKSIQCCITSPPYYGLRDYGTGHWEGGDPDCPHYRTSKFSENDCTGHKAMGEAGVAVGDAIYKSVCPLCGAIRVDEQIGLEETTEQYIQRLVEVFHEVKRVLKDDGTLWVNIGDTYANNHSQGDIKPKDLIGIPWLLAFALRADGWYLRQDIIWAKGNPMPESVTDRCTKSHEYLFLLSKSPNYLFNCDSIKEHAVSNDGRLPGVVRNRIYGYDSKLNNNPSAYRQSSSDVNIHSSDIKYVTNIRVGGGKYSDSGDKHFGTYGGNMWVYDGTRHKRDVWNICTRSYDGAHFATFPEELVLPCILAGTNEGDLVLDIFNGSGTTGIVAIKQGRKYIGIDLNKEYIDLSNERFDKTFFGTKPITEPTVYEGLKKVDLLGE